MSGFANLKKKKQLEKNIENAHRRHIYEDLQNPGWPEKEIVVLLYHFIILNERMFQW